MEARGPVDITKSGAVRYAENPATELMCMSYDFMYKEEDPAKLWVWGDPFPQEIVTHVQKGWPVAAHSVLMEFSMWYYHLLKKLGIPMPTRWIDTQASCAYRGMPLKLDTVGEVLDLDVKKDKRGKYLIQTLCKPRKLLKAEKQVFKELGVDEKDYPIVYREDKDLKLELYNYCVDDTRSEVSLLNTLNHLPKPEYSLWAMDQRINWRGMKVDMEAVDSALDIIDQLTTSLTEELIRITDGKVTTGNEVSNMVDWIQSQGCAIPNLQADTVKYWVERESGDVKRVLEIRQQLGKVSTKKYPKFIETVCADHRCRGLLQYHGASTGRWAGRLVQPHNFPRGSLEKYCEKHGLIDDPEGMAKTMDLLIFTIKLRSLEILIEEFGDPMEALATALRGMFISGEGKELYVADFSAIEAVVTAWLAGEDWKVKAFEAIQRGEGYEGSPDIYCATASGIFGKPITDKKRQAKERGVGKVCLAEDTLVLTNKGIKKLKNVETSDKLWDGNNWVKHDGLIDNGEQKTVDICGTYMTPDHKIWTGKKWIDSKTVVSNPNILKYALETGLESLLSWRNYQKDILNVNVPVAISPMFMLAILDMVVQLDATHAQRKKQEYGEKIIGNTPMFVPTMTHEDDCLIDYPVQSEDVIILKISHGGIMVGAELASAKNGEMIVENFWSMSRKSKAMITQIWKWIELIQRKDMNSETFDSAQEKKICKIKELSNKCTTELENWKTVYDIANAGPNNRFTIITKAGPMIVSNCELAFGYQGGVGAWLNFDSSGKYTEKEIDGFKKAWRNKHPNVEALWWGLQNAAHAAVDNPGRRCSYRSVSYEIVEDNAGKWLSCILPNGRRLWYYNPKILDYMKDCYICKGTGKIIDEDSKEERICYFCHGSGLVEARDLAYEGRDNKKGGAWGLVRSYGGMLTENVVQAIARDIMVEAMFRLENAGYPIILTVHDEIVSEVNPKEKDFKEFENYMTEISPWLEGCPIGVGAWHWNRYRK